MEIIKDKINQIPITYVNVDKFKSVSGILFFKMPIKKEMFVTRTLIRNILIHSCNKYPSNRLLNINCLENFDAYYSSGFRREGNYAINYFIFRCLDEKYSEKNVINNVIDTFYEIIFNPNVVDGKFNEEEYSLATQRLRSYLESEKENATSYAENMLCKQMGYDTAISFKPEIEILNKVTNESLYNEYLNMINNSEIEFIVAGNKVSYISFDKLFLNLKAKKYDKKLKIQTEIPDSFNKKIEEYNGLQSILTVGLKLKDLSDYESTYVLPVYNNILGGGASARLFDTVREKNSLAYSCFSRYEKDDNMIEIISGIEAENYEKTLGLIIKVVNSMKRVTDDEVKRSITEITSSLKESQDDLYNYILPIYASKLYNEKDIKTKIKEIQKVTKEDVEKLFDKIHVTDSFFFKGGKTSE